MLAIITGIPKQTVITSPMAQILWYQRCSDTPQIFGLWWVMGERDKEGVDLDNCSEKARFAPWF